MLYWTVPALLFCSANALSLSTALLFCCTRLPCFSTALLLLLICAFLLLQIAALLLSFTGVLDKSPLRHPGARLWRATTQLSRCLDALLHGTVNLEIGFLGRSVTVRLRVCPHHISGSVLLAQMLKAVPIIRQPLHIRVAYGTKGHHIKQQSGISSVASYPPLILWVGQRSQDLVEVVTEGNYVKATRVNSCAAGWGGAYVVQRGKTTSRRLPVARVSVDALSSTMS